MLNSEFENSVQQKMEELRFTPGEPVWEKIEAGLAKEKKPRRWLIFFILFAGLTCASLLVWDNLKTFEKNVVQHSTVPARKANSNDPASRQNNPSISADTISAKTGIAPTIKGKYKTATGRKNNLKISTIKSTAGIHLTNMGSTKNKQVKQRFNSNHQTRIIITAPIAIGEDEANIKNEELAGERIKTPEHSIDTSIAFITPGNKKKNSEKDISAIKHQDTASTTIEKNTILKKNRSKWEFGIATGAGISDIASGLFNKNLMLARNYQSTPGSLPGSPSSSGQTNPSASNAVTAGFYLEKSLSKKWKLVTELQYSYHSNTMKIGNRIDSSAVFYVDNNKVSADGFYRQGNDLKYKNKYHFLQLPFLFIYKFPGAKPIYLEAGPAFSYMLRSNALLYNSSQSVFYTSPQTFNQWGISFNTGAGIDLSKHSKLPFILGYRFSYGLTSVTKKSFAKQHLINSVIYLHIPLKK